jgi:UDP-N-acetylmuramoyl-L-alanyl-D-glutamate--2,6-diaminopimelate ligase
MTLGDVLAALPDRLAVRGLLDSDTTIGQVTANSRLVGPGDLFVAYVGVARDGHDYIRQAVAQGAAAVIVETEQADLGSVPQIVVPSGRRALAYVSAAQLGYPARSLVVIGVTGTDGKTTTSSLIHHILTESGRTTGLISTVNARIGQQLIETGLHTTTPDAPDVQRYLAAMVEAGSEYAVIETTSHGLAQERTAGSEYDVAVITNVTHEHLDLHGSYEAYLAAKSRLFVGLSTSFRKPGVPKISVLNADDDSYRYLSQFPADVRITYGLENSADVTAHSIDPSATRTRFIVQAPGGEFPVETRLLGRFNVLNALAAVACVTSLGIEFEAVTAGLASFPGIIGRLDVIDHGQPFGVIVDFAHTPNALTRVLELARTLAKNRVIIVFGSAGLRDTDKRSLMGEVAGRMADLIVLTAEDPRTESVDTIINQIAVGCERAGRRESSDFVRIPERGEAIEYAISHAKAGDIVLVCGKGHEQTMCFGETEVPWSDHAAARSVLLERGWSPVRTPERGAIE